MKLTLTQKNLTAYAAIFATVATGLATIFGHLPGTTFVMLAILFNILAAVANSITKDVQDAQESHKPLLGALMAALVPAIAQALAEYQAASLNKTQMFSAPPPVTAPFAAAEEKKAEEKKAEEPPLPA